MCHTTCNYVIKALVIMSSYCLHSMFPTAEYTFSTAERLFSTAEYKFPIAEYKSHTCCCQIIDTCFIYLYQL